jgi:AcrR family transcriptional regulator
MRQPHQRTAPGNAAGDEAEARLRILRAAERLIATHGYAGASLRTIMAEAEVNNASIHYYFGNKQALLRAIFDMRISAMNEERDARFAAIEAAVGDGRPRTADVLRAFIQPAIRRARQSDGEFFNRVSALCSVDPDPAVRQVVFDAYDQVSRRFTALLRRACPHLSDQAFYWRLHCVYGSMMYIRSDNGRVAHLLGELGEAFAGQANEELIAVLTAGLDAPAAGPAAEAGK